ncbi:MAG: hypothetical protein D6797_07215 [Bdellovibrio sp.]|nr:MAG: hypothetical protein D6797_07215 [Bdellovibrio sp.]
MQGIVNINALAREIKRAYNSSKSEESYIMAIHRIMDSVKKRSLQEGSTVKEFLSKTDVNIYGNYAVAVIPREKSVVDVDVKVSFGNRTVIMGKQATIKKYSKVAKKMISGLSVIELVHPEGAEKVPGLVFTIYWKLYEKGINIIETFSIFNTTYILIEKKDVQKALELYF